MDRQPTFEILIVGEDRFQEEITSHLHHSPYTLLHAATSRQVIERVAQHPSHLVVVQFDAPELTPFQLLDELTRNGEGLPIVMMASNPTTEEIVKCLKLGARDFLKYPDDIDKLGLSLTQRFWRREAPPRHESLPAEPSSAPFGTDLIIGRCEKMQQVVKMIQRLSQLKWVTVLILGETGTGKEVIARVLHNASTTLSHEGNFVEMNCTAIPENLLEAELFGYEKGAFTDAKARKLGLFELAEGGSLFLDEMGDMNLNLQAKLLKAIEEKKFRRLGGTVDIQVHTRIIAGTNANLKQAVAEGWFRRDLYYRLNVVNLELPPLRERGEDILLFADTFLRQYSQAYEVPITAFTAEAKEILMKYPWPGNVRELKHAIERAVLLGEQDKISAADLRSALGTNRPVPTPVSNPPLSMGPRIEIPTDGMSLKEGERRLIEEVLNLTKWNRTKASEILGISRPRLKRKIDEYHLEA